MKKNLLAVAFAAMGLFANSASAQECVFAKPNAREIMTTFLKQIDTLKIKNPQDHDKDDTVKSLFDSIMEMETAGVYASCSSFKGIDHDHCRGVCQVSAGGEIPNVPENAEIQAQAITFQFVLDSVAGGETTKPKLGVNGKVRVTIAE